MMEKQAITNKYQVTFQSTDCLVPQNHLVRKLENAIDLRFIHDLVEDLYAPIGRESIDPVVLFKLNIIQYVFGIRSMRQTIAEVEVNAAYRWYLGFGLTDKIPHFSTFSKNYARRFAGTTVFEDIFFRIISKIMQHDFIDEQNVFIDGSHIKANANIHAYEKAFVEESTKYYEEYLQKEINEDREIHGKKLLRKTEKSVKIKEIKASKTDADCGLFHKGEHKIVFAYTANVACDTNNYVLDFEVVAGNRHDSTVFPVLYDKLKHVY